MKPLFLILKKEWYDMTHSGEKKEEYREIKPHWASRLLYRIDLPRTSGGYWNAWNDIVIGDYKFNGWKSFTGGAPVFKDFKHCYLQLGYSDSRRMIREIKEIVIDTGNPDWGAEPGKLYFVIRYK